MQPPEINGSGIKYSKLRPEILTQDVLEGSKDVIFIVDPALQVTYCNPAWDEFAIANGGEKTVTERVLGIDLMSVIAEPLRAFYRDAFRYCNQHHLAFDLDYECSSADLYRLRHMRILPLEGSSGLAIVNSMRVEQLHGAERPGFSPTVTYFNTHGMITLCCNCRRALRQDASGVWDWVPAFLQPEKWEITHGMCPVCVSYFYSRYF